MWQDLSMNNERLEATGAIGGSSIGGMGIHIKIVLSGRIMTTSLAISMGILNLSSARPIKD
jgi:hypothetical protein